MTPVRLEGLRQMRTVDGRHDVEPSVVLVFAADNAKVSVCCKVVVVTILLSSSIRLKGELD